MSISNDKARLVLADLTAQRIKQYQVLVNRLQAIKETCKSYEALLSATELALNDHEREMARINEAFMEKMGMIEHDA